MKMVDCKCFKNLAGFAVSRPPCVVFTVCLAACAIGLFSLGYFVQVYAGFEDEETTSKDWNLFVAHLSSSSFCLSGNHSFNQSVTNSTNVTGPTPVGFSIVSLPMALALSPSDKFDGVFDNISHLTSEVMLSDLGHYGFHGKFAINITLSLPQPWSMDCRKKKCPLVTFETCASLSLPVDLVPKHVSGHETCNVSLVTRVAQMLSWDYVCSSGVVAKTAIPIYKQPTTSKELSRYDAVNLRLQYSSYFLFVLVISCVLYGIIKGKPVKQNFKKSSLPI